MRGREGEGGIGEGEGRVRGREGEGGIGEGGKCEERWGGGKGEDKEEVL